MTRVERISIALLLLAYLTPGATAQEGTTAEPEKARVVAENHRVTLSLEDVPISSALKMLSEIKQVNIVAGSEVAGTISLNLHSVGFEEALDAILGIGGFTRFSKGDIIYVTTEARKAELPFGVHDLQTKTFRINFAPVQEVFQTVTEFLSSSGKVVVSPGGTLVVRDAPDYLAAIESLIEELDTAPRQVLITTKILTVTQNDDTSVGVEFHPKLDRLDLSDVLTEGFAQDLRMLGNNPIGLFAGFSIGEEEVLIEALSERSSIEILASPRLLVIDGQLGSIQVGDRLGFRITTVTETSSLESIEFLEVGTQLEVTPHITDGDLIRLAIHPKVSNGSISIDGLPQENTTEATTDMLVKNGQTVMIGGLLNISKQRVRSQVPILGDIPVLGLLFGRNRWVDSKTEVIILITPEIVDPEPTAYMNGRRDVVEERYEHILKPIQFFQKEESFPKKVGRDPAGL